MQSPRPEASPLPLVILSTADLDAPIWTNKQHIATRLTGEREVHYIESMGLRAPTLSLADLSRIFARISTIGRGNGEAAAGARKSDAQNSALALIHTHTPVVIPFHGSKIVQMINRRLVARNILSHLPTEYALWTFSPLTYGLEEKASVVVYHSVDLLHKINGVPREALLEAERQLIQRADAVVASSQGVANHLRAQGAEVRLWENVADIELFQRNRLPSDQREQRAIFVGNLTPGKVDFDILESIVSRGLRLALAGPYSIDGTVRDGALDRLISSSLVEYLGILSQEEMARELGKSSVGIIPYHVNGYTTGVFLMKVYEYLGAGLRIVSTALPSLAGRNIGGVTITPPDAFAEAVERLLQDSYRCPEGDFSNNSWDSRVTQIRQLLDADWQTTPTREA